MLAILIAIVGAGGIVAQTVLLRELFVSFLGNELTLGLILGSWLCGEAIGALAVSACMRRVTDKHALLVGLLTLFSVSLWLCAIAIRLYKPFAGIPAGQGVGTGMILVSSFLLMLPASVSHGGLFNLLCSMAAASRTYIWETIGTLAGGIALTWFVIPAFSHFEIIRAAALVTVAACTVWLRFITGRSARIILYPLVLACLVTGLAAKPSQVEQYTLSKQYRQGKVLDYQNSWYGNVVVCQKEGQRVFFYNGVPAVTTPVPDVTWSQEFGHLPLAFCKDPKDIMVVNAGLGGLVSEILKEPVARVDYCQDDSLLVRMLWKYPARPAIQELGDTRLNVIHRDARMVLRDARHTYDAIVVGSRVPGDLSSNRFFTDEFFSICRSRLKSDGILALCLPGSLAFISPELRDMNYLVLNALNRHFHRVRIIPGDYNIILASDAADFNLAPAALAKRLSKRGVRVTLLNPAHLKNRLSGQWLDWFRSSTAGATKQFNRDDKPMAVYQVLILWNKQFSRTTMALLQRCAEIKLWMIILAVAGAAAAVAGISRLYARRAVRPAVWYAAAATGFFGMAMNVTLIFAFQTKYGYMYQLIGALTAFFMAGAAAGGIAARYLTGTSREPAKTLAGALACSGLFALASCAVIGREYLAVPPVAVYGALCLVAGILVGALFPLAVAICVRAQITEGKAAGFVFCADIIGAVSAAILAGVILVPVLGTTHMLVILAVVQVTATGHILLIKNIK